MLASRIKRSCSQIASTYQARGVNHLTFKCNKDRMHTNKNQVLRDIAPPALGAPLTTGIS